jgi:hypothetical protein
MSDAARVTNLDELTRFRAGVVKAHEELRLAMAEAESEVGRVRGWLEREQTLYWTTQLRKAQEHVTVCKSALYRKQMITSSKDQKPSIVDEKKALERAQARLAVCEQKRAATRRWTIQINREEILFRAGLAPLSAACERDLPHAILLLKKMIEHLEAYMRLEIPSLSEALGAKAADEFMADMRRHGEDAARDEAEAKAALADSKAALEGDARGAADATRAEGAEPAEEAAP